MKVWQTEIERERGDDSDDDEDHVSCYYSEMLADLLSDGGLVWPVAGGVK